LQLSALVRHLSFRERKPSIVPATGLHSESKTVPKGTFKARTSKRIFSQFFVFRLGLPKMRAESGVSQSDRKAILLRAVSSSQPQKSCHSEQLYREESASGVCRQLSCPASQDGPAVENIWKSCGLCRLTGSYAAPYVCRVSRTVGFTLAVSSPGLNSHRLGGPRFGL